MERSSHNCPEVPASTHSGWVPVYSMTKGRNSSCDHDDANDNVDARCRLCTPSEASGFGDENFSPAESCSKVTGVFSESGDGRMNTDLPLQQTLWTLGHECPVNGCSCVTSSLGSNGFGSTVQLSGGYMTDLSAANLGIGGTTMSCVFCASNVGSYAEDSTLAKAAWPLHELDDEDVIDRVTNAFNEWANETRHSIAVMEERLSAGRSAADYSHPVTAANKAKVWAFLMADVNRFNQQLLAFAQQCPGFEYVSPPDKVALVKHAVLAVWLIGKAELFVDGETYLPLADQSLYTRAWMTAFLPEELVEGMHRYASCQTAAGLTTRELALICAITLMSGRDAELVGRQVVDIVRERLVQALLLEVNRNRVYASETLENIMQLMADLAAISKQQDIIFSKSLEAIP